MVAVTGSLLPSAKYPSRSGARNRVMSRLTTEGDVAVRGEALLRPPKGVYKKLHLTQQQASAGVRTSSG